MVVDVGVEVVVCFGFVLGGYSVVVALPFLHFSECSYSRQKTVQIP